jgi:molybdopterin converting factor small subunit
MTITVHYVAQLRRATGTPSEKIDLDGAGSLRALLAFLVRKYGERLGATLLGESGILRPTILVFVNDEQVAPAEGVPLREGDSVTFLSPIAGGT